MASSKTSDGVQAFDPSKVDVPDNVAAESAKIDAQVRAVHDRKVALVEGDDKAAAKLTETVIAAPVGDDAVQTQADADNKKKGDA